MSGKEAKDHVNNTLELKRLHKRVSELEGNQIKHCISCRRMERHDCYTLFRCPMMGYVDPEKDGCTRHEERKDTVEVKIID